MHQVVGVLTAGLSEDTRTKETQGHEDKKRDHDSFFLVQTLSEPWLRDLACEMAVLIGSISPRRFACPNAIPGQFG